MRIEDFIKHKLTANQYVFILLTSNNRVGELSVYQKSTRVPILSKDEKTDLVLRGLITLEHNGIHLTHAGKTVLQNKDMIKMAQEIWNAYPTFYISGMKSFPLKNVDPFIFNKAYEEHCDEHDEILEDIRFGEERGLIKVKILDFFKARQYIGIREIRKDQEDSINSKYDEF